MGKRHGWRLALIVVSEGGRGNAPPARVPSLIDQFINCTAQCKHTAQHNTTLRSTPEPQLNNRTGTQIHVWERFCAAVQFCRRDSLTSTTEMGNASDLIQNLNILRPTEKLYFPLTTSELTIQSAATRSRVEYKHHCASRQNSLPQ